MSSIFLSHSSSDNAIAKEVKARLELWGHRSIFLDFDPEDGIPSGRDWEKELYAKLRECRAVIILCSQVSMASRWCFAELAHAKALGKEVFPIKIDDTKVDPILTGKQIIDATTRWDEAYQRLEKGLLAAGLDPKDCFDWDGRRPPYPGLSAFQEQDATIFFGRDKEIREGQALLNRLQQFGGPRLTLMLGASGSGKSSLMRAGLLPRLKRDPRWVVIEPFRPLNAPFDELNTALTKRFTQVTETKKGTSRDASYVRDRVRWTEDQATQSAYWFLELMKELSETAASRDATVLLMIDQCEELLTLGANGAGDRFLAFLRAVVDCDDSRFMVLATLRSDFLASFQGHSAMRGLRVETFPVPQMEVDGFASVIEDPARIAGIELGSGLVQAMISDTKTSDALPLLAFTLRELYEGFGDDKRLTLEEYRDNLGGLDGCIARVAEAVLSAKPLSERELSDLRNAFLSMVQVNDKDQYAKQPVKWTELPVSIYSVLERFVTARLLISGGDKNGRTLEVAHEALFRAWPRLAGWLEDNNAFLVWRQRLNAKKKEWETNKWNPILVLPLAADAREWLKKNPDSFLPDERAFVTEIRRQMRRQIVLACTAIIALYIYVGMSGTGLLPITDPADWLWKAEAPIKYISTGVLSRLHVISVAEPKMVKLSGGTYQQGGSSEKSEQPVHQVTVTPFLMGQYEVTFEEYDQYARLSGSDMPFDSDWGRKNRPVINVSWEDANDYAAWLSLATGKQYRLPTESEWEYAARSGGKDLTWAGTSYEKKLADYSVYNTTRTEEVGSKKSNGLDLYDISGNVWEWVKDCWHEDYNGAPTDGSAWLETNGDDCRQRVARGGSWHSTPGELRASGRYGGHTDFRNYSVGFRLVQDIP